jgi:hypothetical protein
MEIEIEELLNFAVKLNYKEYLKFLNRLYLYNVVGTIYSFHKPLRSLLSVNCPKPGIYNLFKYWKYSLIIVEKQEYTYIVIRH